MRPTGNKRAPRIMHCAGLIDSGLLQCHQRDDNISRPHFCPASSSFFPRSALPYLSAKVSLFLQNLVLSLIPAVMPNEAENMQGISCSLRLIC